MVKAYKGEKLVMTYSEKMLAALDKGQLEDAKKMFGLALRNDSDDMLFSLAEELYGLGFLKQAQRTYLKLIERYPDADELKTGLADVLIDEGEIDAALGYLSTIEATSPAYLESLLVMADLYQTEELYEASEQKLLNAYQIAPNEEVILFGLAEFYFNMRRFKEAIKYYKELILMGNKTFSRVDLVSRIGVAYAQAGNFDNAIGYLEQIHESNLTPEVNFQLGFTYFQLKEYDKAITVLQKLISIDDQFASAYPYLGQAYVETNQLADALRTFQSGLAVDEFNETLYRLAGQVAIKLGQMPLAEHYFQQGLQIEPSDMELVLNLSNLYVQVHNDEANIALLSTYVQNDEIDPQIYWNVAKSLTQTNQVKLAQQYWESAQVFFNNNSDFMRELFLFYQNNGQNEQALAIGTEYIKLQPDDLDIIEAVANLSGY